MTPESSRSTIRESFVGRFGEDQAEAVMAAAVTHENGVHDNRGSDPFRWAIAIVIGFQCCELDSYREHHHDAHRKGVKP